MLAAVTHMILAQTPNPMMTTCADSRSHFRDNACCGATLGNSIPVSSTCPTVDEQVTYPLMMGNVSAIAIEPSARVPAQSPTDAMLAQN